MIAFAHDYVENAHDQFIDMLPAIRTQARLAFRAFDSEAKEELVAEVIANAYVAYSRLMQLDKADLAYATPLAMYAVKQVRSGRRVGTKLATNDVMSPANHRVTVENLDKFDQQDGEWREALIEDRRAGPAETAAARLDVAKWFRKLPTAKRRVARVLATGETTKATAKRFGISPARISQLRRELHESWLTLQAEPVAA